MSATKEKDQRAPDTVPQLNALAAAEAAGQLPDADRRANGLDFLPEETEPPKVHKIDLIDLNGPAPEPFHTPSGSLATDANLFILHIRWILVHIRAREGALVAEIDYWLEHLDDLVDDVVEGTPPARGARKPEKE